MEEEKLGHDARHYTFDGFVQKYGDAGIQLWILAPVAVAGAPPPGFAATEWHLGTDGQRYPWAEWRCANDGKPYTHVQFCEHYGASAGGEQWLLAPVAFAGAPQPSILTQLRRGNNGVLYSWSDYVHFYGATLGSTRWLATASPLQDGTATTWLGEP